MTRDKGSRVATGLRCVGVVALASLVGCFLAAPVQAQTAHPRVDFNGDAREDIALGGRMEGAAGLSGASGRTWQRFSGTAIPGSQSFNENRVACDFNGDGFSDLAVGDDALYATPGVIGTIGGGVTLYYGRAGGLAKGPTITQNTAGVPGSVEYFDGFGKSLACGRIGSDGFADLVVGAPGEGLGTVRGAGAVHILFGSAAGISGSGSQMFTQNSAGVAGVAEANDTFGSQVAVGDVSGDGFGEVIVASLGENNYAGMIHSLRGTTTGWTGTGSVSFTGGSIGTTWLGASLTLGRFDGSGPVDLALGVTGANRAGAVVVVPGASANLNLGARKTFSQSSTGVPGVAESGDGFGGALASGDITGDGRDDLLIGASTDRISGIAAGSVTLLKGSSTGLTGTGAQLFHQGSTGVPGGNETADQFGADLLVADFSGDGRKDAIIGAYQEDVGAYDEAGAVTILPGTSSGLTATGAVSLSSASVGIPMQSLMNFGLF